MAHFNLRHPTFNRYFHSFPYVFFLFFTIPLSRVKISWNGLLKLEKTVLKLHKHIWLGTVSMPVSTESVSAVSMTLPSLIPRSPWHLVIWWYGGLFCTCKLSPRNQNHVRKYISVWVIMIMNHWIWPGTIKMGLSSRNTVPLGATLSL